MTFKLTIPSTRGLKCIAFILLLSLTTVLPVSWVPTSSTYSYSFVAGTWSHDGVAMLAGTSAEFGGGIMVKSNDYGLTWSQVYQIPTNDYLFGLTSKSINNTTYYISVATSGYIFNSSGDGSSWSWSQPNLYDLYGVTIGSNGNVFVCGDSAKIYNNALPLSNGNWVDYTPSVSSISACFGKTTGILFYDISSYDGINVIAVGTYGCKYYFSTTGSSGIGSVSSYSGKDDINCVAHGNSTTAFAAGSNAFVAKTVNGGKSWTKLSVYTSSTAVTEYKGISFLNINEVFIAGSQGEIFRSSNGGASWILMASDNVEYLSISIFSDLKGVAGGSGKLYALVPGENSVIVSFRKCC